MRTAAKITARAEKRDLKDGEFTTACAQSCPSKALVFGDLSPWLLVSVAYLAIMGAIGLRIAGRRLDQLLLP